MSSTAQPMTPRPSQLAEALAAQFRQEGYCPGAPGHLTAWARQVDAGICRQARCPQCQARGLCYRPYHKGRSYRVLAACGRCGYGEEF